MSETNPPTQLSATRLRVGVGLWIMSFVPLPLVALAILHNHGLMTGEKQSTIFVSITWGLQYLIGFFGIFLAGSQVMKLARKDGAKKIPKHVWHILKTGQTN